MRDRPRVLQTVVDNEAANFTIDARQVVDELVATLSTGELIQALGDVVNNTIASMKMTPIEVVDVLQLMVDTAELHDVTTKS